MKENHSQLYSLSWEPIIITGNRVALKWPGHTGWEVQPDREPCEVWIHPSCIADPYLYPLFQLTKEVLDCDESYPYPPMIKLDITRSSSTFAAVSAKISVEIVGITSEKTKKFILQPKPRQSRVSQVSLL